MKDIRSNLTIRENERIAKDVYRMVLEGDVSRISRPGQFVNIALERLFLRRPISVCEYDTEKNRLVLIYKVVGKGTEQMAGLKPGEALEALMGLGNGFDTGRAGDSPLLVGGGVGTPPVYGLAKQLVSEGKKPTVILGFNTSEDVFYVNEFEALGIKVLVSTVDGSFGKKGFVTDCLADAGGYTHYYACGPMPMLRALKNAAVTDGQLSFEERMGCGFGACMGCSIETKNGPKRVCKEGPVFLSDEVL